MTTKPARARRTHRGSDPIPGARKVLLVLGSLLILLALYLAVGSTHAPGLAVAAIGVLGVILVAVAAWASDRVVNMAATLFTGWP